jgi:hypothetical protein
VGSTESVALLALTLNEIDGVKAIMSQVEREWADQILTSAATPRQIDVKIDSRDTQSIE